MSTDERNIMRAVKLKAENMKHPECEPENYNENIPALE
jgi:hypothetical protein